MKLLFESSFYLHFDFKETNLNIDEKAEVVLILCKSLIQKLTPTFH